MYLADETTHTSDVKQLIIGPFYVKIIQDELYPETYILPTAAEAFIYESLLNSTEPDFTYILSSNLLSEIQKEDHLESCYTGPTPYQISRTGPDTYIWIRYNTKDKVKLAYMIGERWSKWRLIADRSGTHGLDSFTELTYIFAYSVLRKNGIMLHGVVMEWAGMGIIVSAHSGVGKSTHTNMWNSMENIEIINGDKALCYKNNEVWYTCGSPWCGSSGKCQNKNVALKAIVLLERADINYVVQIPSLQGAMSLIGLTYAPSWNEELMNNAIDLLGDIVIKIPVYKLSCRPDYESVEILKHELQKLI